jgi:multidrug resistance efflux pump
MNKLSRVVIFSLFLLATAGCDEDDRVAKMATQAAQRQAEQNLQMAQLRGQVAEGSKRLVEADARARAELTALQHDLQQSQADLRRQRDQLEADRRGLAAERGRDPIIAAAITTLGLVLACLLPLLLCIYVLRGLRGSAETEAAVAEVLLAEFTDDVPVLLPPPQPTPALDHDGRSSDQA